MRKIIFGVFPKQVASLIASHEQKGNIISDAAVFEAISSLVTKTVHKASSSVVQTLEYVGLPTTTAHVYKAAKDAKSGKTLMAAIVPIDMEDSVRDLFKKFQGNSISAINCP